MGVLKIPGMATGLDTEGIIKTLMQIESQPVTNMQKQQDSMQAEADAWRDVNTRVLTLQQRIQDLANLTSQDWAAKKSSVTDSTVLSVTNTDASAQVGNYTVQVSSLATATTWQSGQATDGSGNPAPIADPAKALNISGTIQVVGGSKNGATFTVAATDSLSQIAANINKNSATLGVTASVSQVNPGDYRLVLVGNTGAANDFSLADAAGSTAAAQLQLTNTAATKVATAANGSMTVNGSAVTFGDNNVKDAVGGLTFNLVKAGTTTVSVSQDQSKVTATVQRVVDQYNSVMDFIDTQTSYDSKTKQAGTLLGDPRLNDLKDGIRSMLLNPVNGQPAAYNSLAMVGVTTQSFTAGSDVSDHLTLDTTKLTNALNADPTSVRNLFASTGTTNPGVATRARNYLDNYTRTGGIILGRAASIDQGVSLMKAEIDRWNTQILPDKEQHLRDQFNALETAMSSMQNQSSWLSAQLKSLPQG